MDDSKITEVYRKPMKCPTCKGKVVEILYGEPPEFAMQLVEEKKLVLGGCCVTEESPKWECVECEIRFSKKIEIQNILKIQPKDNLDKEELQEEVLKDLKRIYKRLNISVSGLMKGIGLALSIPIKFENEQKFSFYPIFEVLKKFDLNIKDMDIYKGEEKNFLNIQIVIKEWSK